MRSSGSFIRQVRTTRSSSGGVMGWMVDIAGGSDARIDAITLACVLPENAALPRAAS